MRILTNSTSARMVCNSELLEAAFATGSCVIRDDAALIVQRMQKAEVLVFATPIYYYEMCGQIEMLLDHSNPLYSSPYRFRKVYLLTAAADETERALKNAYVMIWGGWLRREESGDEANTFFVD